MRKKINPKDWGISDREDEYADPHRFGVRKLPPAPERVKKATRKYDAAWKAWDAAMVVSDKDRELADRVFDKARKQEKKDDDELP